MPILIFLSLTSGESDLRDNDIVTSSSSLRLIRCCPRDVVSMLDDGRVGEKMLTGLVYPAEVRRTSVENDVGRLRKSVREERGRRGRVAQTKNDSFRYSPM